MDILGAYGSSDEDDSAGGAPAGAAAAVNLAPNVSIAELRSVVPYKATAGGMVPYNPTVESLYAPIVGPKHPLQDRVAKRNNLAGHVEEDAIDEQQFEEQRRTFLSYGYALDPSGNAAGQRRYVGNAQQAVAAGGATVFNDPLPASSERKKRKAMGDAALDPFGYEGPWAGYENEQVHLVNDAPVPEKEDEKEKPDEKSMFGPGMEKTTFHGKADRDYLGRTFMSVPTDLDINLLGEAGSQECFIPKKQIHTWTGHTKGVSAIRFFPNTAHLLLSCSMDTKIKIWDVYHNRQVLRTYMGHSKGVRDICFNNDGTRFLSASFDKFIKLWDTETGKCISVFTNKRIPYCVKFNPDADKQNQFLAGCSDKKIVQWDVNTGEIVQEYDQHLSAVNSITFVDDNRRFISTSDDKTVRVWDWGFPVVIKYIADPTMHSMPSVAVSPNKKWWIGQSMDNQILVYSARDRFRQHPRKQFKGHLVAGFACQPSFSPDGRFVTSGDSEGKVWVWDWKTCRVLKTFKAHDKVVIDCQWHPHETSKLATASWDGTIKYWE